MSTFDRATVEPATQIATTRPRTRHLALVVVALWLASTAGAEIVFRLLGERTTTDMLGLFQSFGEGGYKLRPEVRADADTLQGHYTVLTNKLGLRCGETDLRRTPRAIDILVLGDSQSYGEGLSYEDTLVGRLASHASEQGLVLENGAVGGHHLENQFELLRWLDDQGVRPKHVIVILTPFLIVTSGEYNHIRVDPYGRLYDGNLTTLRRATGWLKRHTVVYARLRNAVDQMHPIAESHLTPHAVNIFSKAREREYGDSTLQFLTRLSVWAAERQVFLFIAYAPLAVEMNFDPLLEAARSAAVDVDRNVPFRVASLAATALSVPFVDLRPVLECEASAGQALTLPGDAHYNAPLSAACSRYLWEAFTSHPGANPCAASSQSATLY